MIVCCGEALIDMIPRDAGDGGNVFQPVSGGAIFNTAIALGRLGIKTSMITGLSDDLFGRQLIADLQQSGVDTSSAIICSRPTTLAFVELVDGKATYSFYDENTAGRLILPEDLPELPGEATAFYFGGISLCGEPGADTYLALARQAKENHVVVLDPNIRPGFIEDEQRYRWRLAEMIKLADIVKVSDEDLEWIVPGEMTDEDRVAKLRHHAGTAEDSPIVIITRGGSGATAFMPDGTRVDVAAKPVQVVDTVGAGDTFNAGVLASLFASGVLDKSGFQDITGEIVGQALEKGCAVAAVTVSRVGANPPWAHELV